MIDYRYNGYNYPIIPLNEMEEGKVYKGFCRNATYAQWDGEKFHHLRTKWGTTFVETIHHPENDEHYDVFMVQELAENCEDVNGLLEKINHK